MKTSNYQCVNCQLHFEVQGDYISHYKSQHHRYNIKRKLIGLPPLSFQEYHLQFQDQKTSKQSVQHDFYCEICSKKFMNSGTYKQHLSSKKHKINRAQLKAPDRIILSKSSSSSDFSIIGAQRAQTCIFCHSQGTPNHMRNQHSFPPFQSQCVNLKGLLGHLKQKVSSCECIYCNLKFNSQQSAKQHMNDLGHNKLNIQNFRQYQKYYMWKIEQSSSQSEQELKFSQQQEGQKYKQQNNSQFEQLTHPTLDELERNRLQRIKLTTTGAIINGKQVGYRHLKKYYKQYLNRQIINQRQKYQPAIENDKSSWTLAIKNTRHCERPPKISQSVNFR